MRSIEPSAAARTKKTINLSISAVAREAGVHAGFDPQPLALDRRGDTCQTWCRYSLLATRSLIAQQEELSREREKNKVLRMELEEMKIV